MVTDEGELLAPLEVKQVLVVRKDLNMRKGKIAAQCAHASMKVLLDTIMVEGGFIDSAGQKQAARLLLLWENQPATIWLQGSFAKICVSVNSEEELEEVYQRALFAKIPASLIIDNGRTEFKGVPTKTVVAVGPAWVSEIDSITGHLPLL